MSYDRIVISSGHGKYVRGASGKPIPPCLDEVDEARRVTEKVAEELRDRGIQVKTFHDDVSKTQNENLNRIVDFHNAQVRDLDVSVHFNAFDTKAHGVEVCYLTQSKLATQVSAAIAEVGFTDRGAKHRTDLYVLNHTSAPAILIETCFCDNVGDSETYTKYFDLICENIANVLGGAEVEEETPAPADTFTGKVSWFGGPDDTGVSESEGLAWIQTVETAPQLFLPYQPEGTTGLARRLNPYVSYLAMRWDYAVHSKDSLLDKVALVRNPKTGFALKAFPADWGPHPDTRRIADLSPGLMDALGLVTDDEVEIIFPYES
jgi:N-acetylmuramoyl-L-alanine amidase